MYFLDTGYCASLWPIIALVKNGLIPIIQIGIPIILIILAMLDLGKAVVSSKDDEIKKAQSMLIKRAVYAIAIFFVVTIVNLVFGLFSKTGATVDADGNTIYDGSWWSCWNCGGLDSNGNCVNQ